MTVTVVCDPPCLNPLAWIHRSEARPVARELRRAGGAVDVVPFRGTAHGLPPGPLLLRISDPVLSRAARTLTDAAVPYCGPGAAVIERYYDKHEAGRIAAAAGVDCPVTALAGEADAIRGERILKPRRVRELTAKIAGIFAVDWAGRVDLIHETRSDRLRFLECEIAPPVSAGSVFAASFAAAGVARAEQLRWLVNEA
jgi:hypothetical protein